MEQSIKLFVILGTQKFPFHRLIQAIEHLIEEGLFSKEDILIQSGFTYDENKSLNIINSIPINEFNSILKNADTVITHAGVNSILSCMKNQKDFIIVPRLKQYGEHVDNHQIEIAEVMKTNFNVLVAEDINQLQQLLKEAKDHTYKQWNFDNTILVKSISEFLEE